jgi:hypothetical protein
MKPSMSTDVHDIKIETCSRALCVQLERAFIIHERKYLPGRNMIIPEKQPC